MRESKKADIPTIELKTAKNKLENLVVEGDSENAIEEANNKRGEPLRLAFIYQEYCTNSRWCQFLLTKANNVADGLAKQGICQSR